MHQYIALRPSHLNRVFRSPTVYLNTGKLELPSLSQVQTRGPTDVPWYNHHAAERPLLGSDKLPALSFPPQPAPVPGNLSVRTGSQDSSASTSCTDSDHSSSVAGFATLSQPHPSEVKSAPSSAANEFAGVPVRYPEPTSQSDYLSGVSASESYLHHQAPLGSMNQTQPYMDMHSSHLSSAQQYASHGASAGSVQPYQQYPQPSVLQPTSAAYAPSANSYPSTYPPYTPGGVTSPQSASQHQQPVTNALTTQVPAQILPLPPIPPSAPNPYGSSANPHNQYGGGGGPPQAFDTTGQVAPRGAKPRVTATLWEDEGSLCYQVEAKGVCVARREDNHMINGTKLLNVAGMTRGRRDGILKSEKVRHVVKIGPMHLKGVWIPFERALDFANKEKITEYLYPLFVHNIGGLLYHPSNQTRGNAMVTGDRRRIDGSQPPRPTQGSQPPPLHHHHSMHNPVGSHLSQTSPSSALVPHPGVSRPGLDRAHTFPTPPTSASSLMMGSHGSSYEWPSQTIGTNVQGSQSLSIDTALTTRSMPTTPATTPPGTNMQSLQSYQSQPSYDSTKSYYSAAPSSQPQYAPQQPLPEQNNLSRYGQSIPAHPYFKSEMGPPSAPTQGPADPEHSGSRTNHYSHSQGNGQVSHGSAEGEGGHEQEAEYINDTNSAYNANRGSYTYSATPAGGALTGEPSHLSPELTDTTSHQNGSDRARSTNTQSQWATTYPTSARPAPSSNLYNVMSDTRGTTANGNPGDSYSTTTNPASTYMPSMNGSSKRARDEDDQDSTSRPESRGGDTSYEHKRRKTLVDGGPVGGTPMGIQNVKPSVVARRR
ncbi:hypothetical protein AJ80_05666 [Polytolypa hystricis UAMH7299]|uniref:Cell pattern formation-associated protein stuA n=1 Tax=Polytolypa hystricis (strain UAMH7299) TaxID=1447883 RepID=A0A2B7XTR1_POLH7|nr:hypothetical protein AJ80_05666 [Polytolypa hystricis UAMH7299]